MHYWHAPIPAWHSVGGWFQTMLKIGELGSPQLVTFPWKQPSWTLVGEMAAYVFFPAILALVLVARLRHGRHSWCSFPSRSESRLPRAPSISSIGLVANQSGAHVRRRCGAVDRRETAAAPPNLWCRPDRRATRDRRFPLSRAEHSDRPADCVAGVGARGALWTARATVLDPRRLRPPAWRRIRRTCSTR